MKSSKSLDWIEIANRIFLLYGAKTNEELGKELDFSGELVRQWRQVDPTKRRTPTWKTLEKVVQDKGVTWEWLLTGKEMEQSPAEHIIKGASYRPNPIPVYSAAAADSTGGRVVAENAEEEGYFSLPDGSGGIRIQGDSMEPLGREGQVAIIAPDGRSARDGDLVIVTLKNDKGIFFKRYYESRRAKGRPVTISLVSNNPVKPIPPIVVEEDDIADIRVVTGVMFEMDAFEGQ